MAVGFDTDGKHHDDTLHRVLQTCKVNLQLNKDKCHFTCTQVHFFGEIISTEAQSNDGNDPSKNKKNSQAFLGIINYLGKFSPRTADICTALRQLTSVKTEWTWNAIYKKFFDKVKSIMKEDMYMKFNDTAKPLHLKTDTSGVGLGAHLLQTGNGRSCPRDMAQDNNILRPIIFTCKNL